MPRRDTQPLTAAEWKVMQIVWKQQKCAARDVYQVAAGRHGWAATTTKTILRRLVDKGQLKTTRVGNSFLYEPTRSALSALRGAADTLLDRALEGTVGPLVTYMVEKGRLSAEELAQLRSLIDEMTDEDNPSP